MTRSAEIDPCASCHGTGEQPSDHGVLDCPDCGGSGTLPSRAVRVEWRARDIERAAQRGEAIDGKHIEWLVTELRNARDALTKIDALAHDTADPDSIGLKIRVAVHQALGLRDNREPDRD